MPKVTILMTVLNVEKYIRTAVFSMLNQTFRDFELLIINDGSTDNTEEIILSFKDTRIRYYNNQENTGISNSLNKGINLSIGKYTARMDGDDISYPDRLAKQVHFLDTHRGHGLVGSWYYVINSNSALRTVKRKATKDMDIRLAMLFENQFIHSSVMMRTDMLKEMLYDPELEVCEDYDLFMRFLYETKVANVPEELITYRWYGGNTSIVRQKAILESFIKIFSRTLDHYGISHTTEELFVHSMLAFRYAQKYFTTKGNLFVLDAWLNKIANAPGILSVFNKESVKSKLDEIRRRAIFTPKKVINI